MPDYLNRSCELVTQIVSIDQDLATLDNMYSTQCKQRTVDRLSEIISDLQKMKSEISNLRKEDYIKV